ncbi:MAG: ABC transporter permease [Gammaproteobacteria bacterium]|nr:ABC transporter permease [Pseudomonadales bacterium]MCP5348484.1 ABC transporter permease [Pseudomonadales bacterium]
MLFYYLRLGALSYRRNPVLSTLMVMAVAIGVGSYMVVFTLNYVMGGDPIPQKSSQLYHVQLDSGDPDTESDPPEQLTYLDSMALIDADLPFPRTATSKFFAIVEPDGETRPFSVMGRGSYADFFTMFNVPFLFGSGWDRSADRELQQVVVLSRELNERLFGGVDSVGESVLLDGYNFQVIGVVDDWTPIPKFYDVNNGPFDPSEEVYIPWPQIINLDMQRSGNTNCWKPLDGSGIQAFLNSECIWLQFWVELADRNDRQLYQDYLDNYVREQKQLGRFQRPLNNHLYDVNEWLLLREVLPNETRILSALAAMLLGVCLLNTIGLLLSKFLGKAGEIGVRQALGANKASLFIQHVVEAGFIGLLGGLLGLGVAALGLQGIRILLGDLMVTDWIQLDTTVVTVTIGLAILSTIVAGLYPIWRACRINPSTHLKTQ